MPYIPIIIILERRFKAIDNNDRELRLRGIKQRSVIFASQIALQPD
jgi:hypothetical protein